MKKLTILLAVLLLSAATYADTIEVYGNTGGYVDSTSVHDYNLTHRYVAVGSAEAESGILIFQLPELTGGENIVSANLSDYVGRAFSSSGPVVDLYILRVSNSRAYTTDDWYTGTNDTTDATLIQADFFNNTSIGGSGEPPANPDVSTSTAGDAALAAWLQANAYSGSSPVATYIVFRYSAETATGTYTGYGLNYGGSNPVPTLTIETSTTPEPATLGLLALGGLAMLKRRRRQR